MNNVGSTLSALLILVKGRVSGRRVSHSFDE